MKVVDISNPAALRVAGFYASPDRARDVIAANGVIYLADYLSGLRILQP